MMFKYFLKIQFDEIMFNHLFNCENKVIYFTIVVNCYLNTVKDIIIQFQ